LKRDNTTREAKNAKKNATKEKKKKKKKKKEKKKNATTLLMPKILFAIHHSNQLPTDLADRQLFGDVFRELDERFPHQRCLCVIVVFLDVVQQPIVRRRHELELDRKIPCTRPRLRGPSGSRGSVLRTPSDSR
jgi:hypothetical protein